MTYLCQLTSFKIYKEEKGMDGKKGKKGIERKGQKENQKKRSK